MATLVVKGESYVLTKADVENLKLLNELRYQLPFLEKDQSPEEILQTLSRLSFEWAYEKNHVIMGDIYRMRIACYILQGDYGWAFNEVNKVMESVDDPVWLGFSFYALGDIYFSLNLPEKAISNYLQARDCFEKNIGLEQYGALVNLRLLFIYLSVQQRIKAKSCLLALQKTIPRLNPALRPPELLMKYAQASYSIETDDFVKSSQLIAEFETCRDSTYNPCLMVSDVLRVNYYLRKGDLKEAYIYVQKCLKASDDMYDAYWRIRSLMKRAQVRAAMGNMEGACEDCRYVYHLKDSLMSVNFVRQDNTLHLTYPVDEKATLRWQERQHTLFIFILCIGALLLIGLGLMVGYAKKNKKLKKLRMKLDDTRKEIDENIKAKSLFLSNMSHEIRTPLNAISGFSELLISQTNMDMELRKQCDEMIQQNSNLLMKLLNDVLDLSNLDIQKMSFKCRECNVIPLCRAIVETIKSIKRTEAEVSFQTSLRELFLYTDENRLQQMLLNILVNATKFTKSGSIVLSLEKKSDGLAYFSVTDTGIGISKEQQYKIFSRFEKLDENSYGYGLGLSICKLIITRLGGKIWVDPEYKNGARFVFTHPIK